MVKNDKFKPGPPPRGRESILAIAAASGRLMADISQHSVELQPLHRSTTKRKTGHYAHSFLNLGPQNVNDFMQHYFVRVECTMSASDDIEADKCKFCKRDKAKHAGCLFPTAIVPQFNFDQPTNAYGTLSFPGKRNAAEYVRVGKTDTAVDGIIRLFREVWKLPEPDLVVSIIGGFQQFKISSQNQRQIFNDGLINAIDATGGWLITYGNSDGTAKVVGDAVREGQTTRLRQGDNREIVCIGVVAWGLVQNSDMLTFENPPQSEKFGRATFSLRCDAGKFSHYTVYGLKKVAMVKHYSPTTRSNMPERVSSSGNQIYKLVDGTPVMQPVDLNVDHTHFLLVDNGYAGEKSFVGAVELRASLEKMISDHYERATVVALVVGGGKLALQQLYNTMLQDTEILVCEGTGNLANIIARGFKNAKLTEKEFFERMEGLSRDAFFGKTVMLQEDREWLQRAIKQIYEICNRKDRVLVLNLTSRDDLYRALLRCILKRTDDSKKLELALTWNRHDVAEKIADQPGFDIEQPKIFTEAIRDNKVEFVKLFVKHGFNIAAYLTAEKLENLYHITAQAQRNRHFLELLQRVKRNKEPILLTDISKLEYYLLKFSGCQNRYAVDDYRDVFHEIFIHSVFFNRYDMAHYCWTQCERPLLVALIGAWLAENLQSFYQRMYNTAVAESYAEMKSQFSKNAVGILDRAYSGNPVWAADLINSSGTPQWPNLTIVEIGALAECEEFIAHECCQKQFFMTWSRGYESSRFKKLVAFVLVVPIFFNLFVKFKDDNAENHDDTVEEQALLNDKDIEADHLPGLSPVSEGASSETSSTDGDSRAGSETSKVRRLQTYRKPFIFYNSASSKFLIYTCSYMIFLMLYSTLMMFDFDERKMSVLEMFIYYWQFALNVEMLHTIISARSEKFWSRVGLWYQNGSFGTWHKLDALNCLISSIAFGLRMANVYGVNEFCYPIARMLMILNMIIYYLRIFKTFFVHQYLGPKVIMIWRMSGSLMMFLLFFLVFMLTYSVSSRSLAEPLQDYKLSVFWDLIKYGLWEIFGEANPDNKEGLIEECKTYSVDSWFATGHSVDCLLRTTMLPVLLTLYMFVSTILLVNMLIAIFSHIFETVDVNSKLMWRYQMYFLIKEYDNKFILPPPLNVFYVIYKLTRYIVKHGCRKREPRERPSENVEDSFLVSYEKVCQAEYLSKEDSENSDIQQRLERIEKQLKDLKKQRDESSSARSIFASSIDRSGPPLTPAPRKSVSFFYETEAENIQEEDEAEHNQHA